MTKPPLKVRLYGHPIVVISLAGITGWLAYLCYLDDLTFWRAVLAVWSFALFLSARNASKVRAKYRQFTTEFNAMEGRTNKSSWPMAIGMIAVAVIALWVAANVDAADVQFGGSLILAGIGLLIGGAIVRLIAKRPRRRRAEPEPAVQVVVQQAGLPAPNLAEAVAALPAYCHRLLDGDR